MERISREALAMVAAASWKRQYPNEKIEIYTSLKKLGSSPIPDEVDEIVGNSSWTDVPQCSVCGEDDLPYVIEIEECYGPNHFHLCRKCVTNAYIT